jgi:hypothetical protein
VENDGNVPITLREARLGAKFVCHAGPNVGQQSCGRIKRGKHGILHGAEPSYVRPYFWQILRQRHSYQRKVRTSLVCIRKIYRWQLYEMFFWFKEYLLYRTMLTLTADVGYARSFFKRLWRHIFALAKAMRRDVENVWRNRRNIVGASPPADVDLLFGDGLEGIVDTYPVRGDWLLTCVTACHF